MTITPFVVLHLVFVVGHHNKYLEAQKSRKMIYQKLWKFDFPKNSGCCWVIFTRLFFGHPNPHMVWTRDPKEWDDFKATWDAVKQRGR